RRRRVDRRRSRTSPRGSRQDSGEDLPDLAAPPPELRAVADGELLRRHLERDAPHVNVVGDAVRQIRQRDLLASAALHLIADLGSVVELELLLIAEVPVSHDVHGRLRDGVDELAQKLQAVALPVDHPQRHELAPELLQAAVERASVLLDREVVSRRRVDHHDALAVAVARVDEVDPAVGLVEVDELRLDLLLYAFHTSGFDVSHSTRSTLAPCSSRWSSIATVIIDLPTPPLLPPTQQIRPAPLPSAIAQT